MFVNKVELYLNGELLDSSHDRKILSQIPVRDKTVIVAKVYDGHLPTCASDTSSDSSSASPPLPPTPEHALPGAVSAPPNSTNIVFQPI